MSSILIQIQPSVSLSAASVTGLSRSDNGNTPSGVSLPLAMASSVVNGVTVWGVSFSDATPPAYYSVSAILTESSGSVTQSFSWTIPGTGGAIGSYTTQALIESIAGYDADVWSNISNTGTSPVQARYQSAINSVESVVNGRIQDEFYSTPIPPTSPQFLRLSEIATKLSMVELYITPRGIRDDDKIGGQLSKIRDWAFRELDTLLTRPVFASPGIAQPRTFSAPSNLVQSDWRGNPRPMVSNTPHPQYLYPGWFYGGFGSPFGMW